MHAFVDASGVESILKVLDAKAGWIQEDESKLLLRKALFSVEREAKTSHCDSAQQGGWRKSRQLRQLSSLGYSIEGRSTQKRTSTHS